MREVHGPDSLFVIEVEMCEEASGEVHGVSSGNRIARGK